MDKQDKRITQPERAFWRDAFLAAAPLNALLPNENVVKASADFADLAVQEYRTRILWRDRK